jgi:hypothetical protein
MGLSALVNAAKAPRVPPSPRKSRTSRTPRSLFRAAKDVRRAAGVDQASQRILMGFVLPLWMAAGVADWWFHRKSEIQNTSGTHESLTHAAMMAQGGIPTTLSLFFEVNAGVLAATYAAAAGHQATAIWDVKYANDRREVSDMEQHVHAALEMTPVMAAGMITAIHWDQARSLFRRGGEKPHFKLEPKRYPLPAKYKYGVLAATAAFVVAPYTEELLRCWRVDRTLEPHEPAADAIAVAQADASKSPDVGAPSRLVRAR